MDAPRTQLAIPLLIVAILLVAGMGVGLDSIMSDRTTTNASIPVPTAGDGDSFKIVSLSGETEDVENLGTSQPASVTRENLDPGHSPRESIRENLNPDDNSYRVDRDGISMRVTGADMGGINNPFFDAGGPYGGPNCYEGNCTIHFEITTDDPSLIFFRWDLNNDSIWDTPWIVQKSYDVLYIDNINNDVYAEGWDGISTQTTEFNGSNLAEVDWVDFALSTGDIGWKFSVNNDMTLTHLGYYKHIWNYTNLILRIWDFNTRTLLGQCSPQTDVANSWNWCQTSSPLSLVMTYDYLVSGHKTDNNKWTAINNYDLPWDSVRYQGYYYGWTYIGSSTVPKVDFKWRYTLLLPLTQQDSAPIEVKNVAPTIVNVTVEPSLGNEGSFVRLSATFDDPGIGDTWQFRWKVKGNWTDWMDVTKELPMPIGLPAITLYYGDDEPVTASPHDSFNVSVEVRDDDHLKFNGRTTLLQFERFFEDCDDMSFPPGWNNTPNYGWRCRPDSNLKSRAAVYQYLFNDYNTSLLTGPPVNLTSFNGTRVEWTQHWRADFGRSYQDGYVEMSFDNGTSYPYLLEEFHHNDPPGPVTRKYSIDIPEVSNASRIRFRIDSGFDWYWIVDDIKVQGVRGYLSYGLGNNTFNYTIMNVEPALVGGPTSDTTFVGHPYTFDEIRLSDSAIWEPTEWFAYKFDFGDGVSSDWARLVNLSPPKLDILVLHSLCYNGNGCSNMVNLLTKLFSLEITGSVAAFNFFNYPNPRPPSLSYMMQFDLIVFASEYAWIGLPVWEGTRIVIGNNLATYLDTQRGGLATFMGAFDVHPNYGDIFGILGRYMDQEYGPYEKGAYIGGLAYFPPTINMTDHPVVRDLDSSSSAQVTSGSRHSGDLETTDEGYRVASWNDGGAAVGVKDKAVNKRTCAIGAHASSFDGLGALTLLDGCIGWAAGAFLLPPTTHVWTSPGIYNVNVSLIDDDMGWTWDSVNNVPVPDPLYAQTVVYRIIQIDVRP